MLLTITTTHQPATDLGYLLHKHPQRVFEFDLPTSRGYVFYPEATPERCTVALMVEADPVALSRGRSGKSSSAPLEPYVNDRPYAASSLLTSALRQAFGTAMTGRSKERPELAARALPFSVHLPAIPSRGDLTLAAQLFEPLGYQVTATPTLLDEQFPEWGHSPYLDLRLTAEVRLADLLAHLYVLVPVLDDSQHYYVDEAEIDKLLRRGEGWLKTHPLRQLITRRFLKHRRALERAAQIRFDGVVSGQSEEVPPVPISLNQQRLEAVTRQLLKSGAASVLDLGCGEGNLLAQLLPEPQFTRILGLDVSPKVLEQAKRHLKLDELPPAHLARLSLVQGSLTYQDERLRGYDAAALVEVIEHLDEQRLWALERVVFGDARPKTVIVTTPNAEYNAHWTHLPAGSLRHQDHRFEWTQAQFRAWAGRVGASFGYAFSVHGIGTADALLGSPTQMAIFRREEP